MSDVNIELHTGEATDLDFTIEQSDGTTEDLTKSQVDEVYLDVYTQRQPYGEEQFSKPADTKNANGVAEFTIESSDTTDLSEGNYVYEIYVDYTTDGDNYTAEVGKFFVKPRVDR